MPVVYIGIEIFPIFLAIGSITQCSGVQKKKRHVWVSERLKRWKVKCHISRLECSRKSKLATQLSDGGRTKQGGVVRKVSINCIFHQSLPKGLQILRGQGQQ